jgi:spore maturation protein CgeB
LTGYTDEITECYEIGQEIDTYRTPDELVDKARFYLGHPDIADRLRERGEARARRDHTWKHRFAELFKKTELRRW